ncbi:hypothetical protein HPB52_010849 [Rhipicephalus sanguineus]|uniref:Transmembrane protein n=1 Tax=Rhipicephalus sanguineus TaxID=34632 RepID=A0A9D4PZ77_RHISA|nr:hypothetical protein HPB52_010849 [Rhipicephalus sanguineus]
MYAQRYVSSLPRYSLSAPSLGSSSPAPATRPGCINTPIDSLCVQHSESSSPTTSLLLQMWGYDQAHAPSSSGRAVDLHADLADEAGTPQWLRVVTDLQFLRRTTVTVCGLAVLTCFVAVLLTAANQLRTHEWVDEHVSDNWTKPVRSLVEDRWLMSYRSPTDVGKNQSTGSLVSTSSQGAVASFSGTNETRMRAQGQTPRRYFGGLVKPARLPPRERLYRPETQQPDKLRRVLYHIPAPEETGISTTWRER